VRAATVRNCRVRPERCSGRTARVVVDSARARRGGHRPGPGWRLRTAASESGRRKRATTRRPRSRRATGPGLLAPHGTGGSGLPALERTPSDLGLDFTVAWSGAPEVLTVWSSP